MAEDQTQATYVQSTRHVVRDAADINRLIFRLFTRWRLPRVEIRIDSLPAVAVQLAQHRIRLIAEAPVGGLGMLLATVTLLGGIFAVWSSVHTWIWTSRQFWMHLLAPAVAALYVGVMGKVIGELWTRVRLALELRRLRRLATGRIIREPARYIGCDVPRAPVKALVIADPDDAAGEALMQRTVLSRPRRPRVQLRNTADMKRLLVYLITHWKLPRVHIDVGGVAPLEVQRAQHRLVLLSEACNCVLGACLAGATILGGAFAVEWVASHTWDWMVPDSWGPLGLVAVAALCAALIGWMLEWIWTRVKLLLVLHGVRHRLGV